MTERRNIEPAELDKFEDGAYRWWDAEGAYRTLHDINPLRLAYVDECVGLAAKEVLDVGCGGGLLSEAMAARGARVIGLDASEALLRVARMHLIESGVEVDYVQGTAEELATSRPRSFDAVTCLELLEHVPRPEELVEACARLVREGGHVLFSTVNRTPKSWLYAIVGAEYVLGLLPKGTHEYQKLIRPSELCAWGRRAGLELIEMRGMRYDPLTRRAVFCAAVDVNYFVWMRGT